MHHFITYTTDLHHRLLVIVSFTQVVGQLVLEERTDNNDILLEVTAGVGGQEAMLFTDQMLKMYTNFALTKRWTFDTIEYDPSEQGISSNISSDEYFIPHE